MTVSVLFVCSRNVCRSAAAHAVFRYLAGETGLAAETDSAGIAVISPGQAPDAMACKVLERRGYDASSIRATPLQALAPGCFDYLLALDASQLQPLREWNGDNPGCVRLLMTYSDYFREEEVLFPTDPDAMYGYTRMLDRIEDACLGLWRRLSAAN